MDVGGYGKVIVDLAGISFASPKIPIVYGHIVKCGIGHVEKSEIRDGALVLEGVVSRQTEYAKDFTSSAKNGFPWQASIGGTPLEVEFLNDDATAVVNGRTVDASVTIIRKISLYETSDVEFGADGATSSTIKCSIINPQGGNDNMSSITDTQTPIPQPQTPVEPPVNEPTSPPTGAVDFGAKRRFRRRTLITFCRERRTPRFSPGSNTSNPIGAKRSKSVPFRTLSRTNGTG